MNDERTPLFYMANLGAEVSRLYAAKKKDDEAVKAELQRCMDIIDALVSVESHFWRRQEVSILKDVLEDIAAGNDRYDVSEEDLEEYFLPFALRLQAG